METHPGKRTLPAPVRQLPLPTDSGRRNPSRPTPCRYRRRALASAHASARRAPSASARTSGSLHPSRPGQRGIPGTGEKARYEMARCADRNVSPRTSQKARTRSRISGFCMVVTSMTLDASAKAAVTSNDSLLHKPIPQMELGKDLMLSERSVWAFPPREIVVRYPIRNRRRRSRAARRLSVGPPQLAAHLGEQFQGVVRITCRPILIACSSRSSPRSTFSASASARHCRVNSVAA